MKQRRRSTRRPRKKSKRRFSGWSKAARPSPLPHRLSTLRSADRLLVLDGGKIAEIGTHEELMAREGIFYNLVQTQRETSAVMATSG